MFSQAFQEYLYNHDFCTETVQEIENAVRIARDAGDTREPSVIARGLFPGLIPEGSPNAV